MDTTARDHQQARSSTEPLRIVLYSHDSVGLGHVRRNLTLAHRLAVRLPELTGRPVTGLLVTGLPQASRFPLPEGFDWLALPSLTKGRSGYQPRHLNSSMDQLVQLRTGLLTSALVSFAPDLFIIDRHLYGVRGELRTPLAELRRTHPRTRVVLGLREVLDEPSVAAAEWERLGEAAELRRTIDQVWVYGDSAVHHPVETGEVPFAFAQALRFTGYLACGREDGEAPAGPAGGETELSAPLPFILTTVGGGSDGFDVVRAAVQAEVPAGHQHMVVTGPQMSQVKVTQARDLADPGVLVRRTVAGLSHHIARASAVITMGGYNSACEVLATDTPALMIPREVPRTEQLIRATGLADRGLVDMMRGARLTPGNLSQWMHERVGHRIDRTSIRRDGLEEAAYLAAELLTGQAITRPSPAASSTGGPRASFSVHHAA